MRALKRNPIRRLAASTSHRAGAAIVSFFPALRKCVLSSVKQVADHKRGKPRAQCKRRNVMPSDAPGGIIPELWAHIGTWLPPRDLFNLQLASKQMQAIQKNTFDAHKLLDSLRRERARLMKDVEATLSRCYHRLDDASPEMAMDLDWLKGRLIEMLNLLDNALQSPLYPPKNNATSGDLGVPVGAGAEWQEFVWAAKLIGLFLFGRRPDTYLLLQAQCNRISTMVVDRWGLSAVDWRPKKYDD
jgi:hypothetical protein